MIGSGADLFCNGAFLFQVSQAFLALHAGSGSAGRTATQSPSLSGGWICVAPSHRVRERTAALGPYAQSRRKMDTKNRLRRFVYRIIHENKQGSHQFIASQWNREAAIRSHRPIGLRADAAGARMAKAAHLLSRAATVFYRPRTRRHKASIRRPEFISNLDSRTG